MITAAVVVLVGVEEGILLAMTLSLLRIVHHSYHPHTAALVEDHQRGEWRSIPVIAGAVTKHGLVIYRFGAPLFYANANRFSQEVRNLVGAAPSLVRWVVVDASSITNVDYTAARFVRQLKKDLTQRSTGLAFAHVQPYLRADLERHHLTEVIGPERLYDSLHEALAAMQYIAL